MDGFPVTVQAPRQQSSVIKWFQNNLVSMDAVTMKGLADDIAYEVGTVLSKLLLGAAVAAAVGGNTGTGILTLDAAPLDTGAQVGVYHLVCIGGTDTVGAPAFVGTGNGVLTRAAPAFAAGVLVGNWKVTCVAAAANGGEFSVRRPDGTIDGYAKVGVAYDGYIKFTVADGAADFIVGDEFTLAVTAAVAANSGVFSVTAPDGTVLPNATVGVAYDHQIKGTIADGGVDFIVGDGFTVTIAAGSAKYVALDFTKHDGSEVAVNILADRTFIPANTDVVAPALIRHGVVVEEALIWPAGATDNQKAAALALLATHGITTKPQV